ncbi:MAG: DNA topoisomerase 3 [Ruminococcus sp.]|uniref:type IA DNA topoisomerase n=1 Tax=Ruminococcus sp. TaxID=41978 RepID=UPI0025F54817|nr:type IA DNA topoisomerase [Ruminococcus sp.]MCR5539244.1 DNA topoisomerase 3 [Ruminococcus sp.]
MKLVIAEKPSVMATISQVIGANSKNSGYNEGNGYIVSSCFGHLVALKDPGEYKEEWGTPWSFSQLPMFPEKWMFKLGKGCSERFHLLKKLMNDERVDEIVCATDAGREGECIFRYVYNLTGCRKPVSRLWVSSMEEAAIKKGFDDLRPDKDYNDLFSAGFCRAKADWLVGMNASRLFSVRYSAGLSVGRVQTPTLALIVQRDYDIKHFVKQKYFKIVLDCGTFKASSENIAEESYADQLLAKVNGKTAVVKECKKEVKTANPPKLYDLTTLQREANRQFGYTAQKTLDFLQSLYEKGLATYPRTDSQYLTDDMEQTALETIDIVYKVFSGFKAGEITHDVKRCINNKKVSDHHAVIPTKKIENYDLNELSEGEQNILKLISAKLITATASPHKYEAVSVTVSCEGENFYSSGKTIIEKGWKAIDDKVKAALKNKNTDKTDNEEKALPDITEGQSFNNVQAEKTEHWTSPPKPYTEDTLLGAMERAGMDNYDDDTEEKKGLGTPATRAAIIEILVKRCYVERKNKALTATDRGVTLIEVLPEEVKSPKLTADWEMLLQKIERGQYSANDFMDGISEFIRKLIAEYSSKAQNEALTKKYAVVGKCPKCGSNVIALPKAYVCEKGKEKCGFGLAKVICEKTISEAQVKKLLEKGTTDMIDGFVSKKTEKKFSASLVLNDDKTVGFKLPDYGSNEPVGKCPKCGAEVVRGKFGFYCKGNCGMFLGKVFGKVLSETQIRSLLGGKSIILITKGRRTMVLPQYVENEFNGKKNFQWKTQEV